MIDHLLIEIPKDFDALATWRWFVGPDAWLVALSLSGDAFYCLGSDVFWLDAGLGATERVAGSEEEFWTVLDNPERAEELLLQPVVEEFLQAHGQLAPGRCIGFVKLPVFGGKYAGPNRVSLPVREHFGLTGELHMQVRDLPDGSKVRVKAAE